MIFETTSLIYLPILPKDIAHIFAVGSGIILMRMLIINRSITIILMRMTSVGKKSCRAAGAFIVMNVAVFQTGNTTIMMDVR